MIEIEKITIKVNRKEIKYFQNSVFGEIMEISVFDLPFNSTREIEVVCDVCGNKKITKYGNYNRNIQNQGIYACCLKCSNIKSKNTKKERYGDENYNNTEKHIQTNISTYGVEHTTQLEEVKNKSKNTKKERYGDENYNNSEKNKITNMILFGVEHATQNKDIQEKQKSTIIKNHGVEYPLQNEEIYTKYIKNSFEIKYHEETKLYYQGSYEKHFLDYCFSNNITVEKGPRIKYIFNDKEHYYFSDFYIKEYNLIVEIKSKWTYNIDLDKNLKKKEYSLKEGYKFIFIIDKNYECLFS